MLRLTFFVLIITFCFSCFEKKKTSQNLSAAHRMEVEKFSIELIESINGFDFSVINSSWNNGAFKTRVSGITKTQSSVFEHIFEKDLKRTIKVGNLSIIHQVNSEEGHVSLLKLNHFDHHSELILLLSFDERFDFLKYRIELIQNKPAITDFYHFKDNLWYSERIINMLRLNSKYDAYSDERHAANRAMYNFDKHLSSGDTLEALYSLYDIPETHRIGNGLSMKKLSLASALGDSIYSIVLATEYENNKSLYMQYLYDLHFEGPIKLNRIYDLLSSELGESATLDSLLNSERYWN